MNSLTDPKISSLLNTLHTKAKEDHNNRMRQKQAATEQKTTFNRSWNTAYMAVTADEGSFLHFLATVTKAKNIVEFGCSFGISTIYLAAAARNNGGHVVTTDIEPNKISGARANINDAGLGDFVTLLQGDATQTLATVEGPVDFLFLDGAKELYLPVFKMLLPKLSKGAVIFADNADKAETRLFVDYMLQAKDEFTSIQLFENRALVSYLN